MTLWCYDSKFDLISISILTENLGFDFIWLYFGFILLNSDPIFSATLSSRILSENVYFFEFGQLRRTYKK